MIYVPGVGKLGSKLLILGECPSPTDTHNVLPFQGPAGRELNKLLYDAEINRDDCWVTNVCKYEVPPSPYGKKIPFQKRAETAGINLQDQVTELFQEINTIKPNCILALGGTALWALSGKTAIQKYRGSILTSNGFKYVPSYNPGHILHSADSEIKGYWNRLVMLFDFKRAKEESASPVLELPQRHVEICQSSYQLYEFWKRYKDRKKLAADIEAHGTCLPACIGLAFNKHHAMVVPFYNEGGISQIPTSDLSQVWIILNEILSSHDIIGQNFKYDEDKIARIGFSIKNLSDDLLLKAFTISPELPKNLGFLTSIYTREPFYKDEGMYEGTIHDLFIGCGKDACVTFEINEKMDADIDEMNGREWYENFEMKLHPLYLQIEKEGFLVDPQVRDELIDKYVRMDEQLQFRLFQLTGKDINVTSWQQVAKLLYEDMKLPVQSGTGEEELTKVINNKLCTKEGKEACELILTIRRVKKTIGTYMLALPDFDGRMRTTFFLCLETGRTRTSQLEPPIRPRVEVYDYEQGKSKKKDIGMAFQTITKHGDIGNDIRRQFVVDSSEVFVQADSSQAEARVVALLADDEETLLAYDNHDIHALTASWFFGGTESDHSKKVLGFESPIRFAGKTLRHAGHLGAGARRAATELNTQARKNKIEFNISEKTAKLALDVFHKKSPKIRSEFHAGVIKALQDNGRRLIAPVPFGIKSKLGGQRVFYERWDDELFRQAFSYIPQRAVSDNTKAAALRLKKRFPWLRIILEAHDALLFSIPEKLVDEFIPIIRSEMERPIRFENSSLSRHDLIIPCDVEVGYNYMELNKWKKKVLLSA